jgi:hypothetical protein
MSEDHTNVQLVSAIVEAVEDHPSRWEDIPLETALSLPMPSLDGSAVLFFIYPVGGPINNRLIFPPTHHVSASLRNAEDIRFDTITPEELGFAVSPDTAVAKDILKPRGEGAESYDHTFSQLCAALDQIMKFYPVPNETLETDREQLLQSYHSLFTALAKPALLPAYHALNPHFFVWLQSSGRQTGTIN